MNITTDDIMQYYIICAYVCQFHIYTYTTHVLLIICLAIPLKTDMKSPVMKFVPINPLTSVV